MDPLKHTDFYIGVFAAVLLVVFLLTGFYINSELRPQNVQDQDIGFETNVTACKLTQHFNEDNNSAYYDYERKVCVQPNESKGGSN